MQGRINLFAFALLSSIAFLSGVATDSKESSKVNTSSSPMSDDASLWTTTSSNPNGLSSVEMWGNGSTVKSLTTYATRSIMTWQWSYPSTTVPPNLLTRSEAGPVDDTANSRDFSWYPINWSWVSILQLSSAIIGIVGNFLVIVVLIQRRRESRSMDTLIVGLAYADFLTSVFLIPIPWPSYIPKTWLGEIYCKIFFTKTLLWVSITASTYLLMSISVERYIAIVYPLHFRHLITRRRVSIFIIMIWFLSVLSGIYGLFVYGVDEYNGCSERYSFIHAQAIIAYYWFGLRMAVPCLTMIITQVLIARKLSHQSRNFRDITNATNGTQAPSFHIVARNRVLKMMLIVILIYFVCWTPSQIAYLGYSLGWVPASYPKSNLERVLIVLGFGNSCANPVIYAARYPEFRGALKDMLTCTSPQKAPLFEKGDMSKNSSGSEAVSNKV